MPVSLPPSSDPARMLGMVFGIVFAGIGLTVIGFPWSLSGFGDPPLIFFKLFGSFIAIAFVAVDATFFMAAVKGQIPPSGNADSARLDAAAEVSPKGDVKCGYCKQWFNIHG